MKRAARAVLCVNSNINKVINSDVAVVTYINKKVIDDTALIKFCKSCEIWKSKNVSIESDDTQITNAP